MKAVPGKEKFGGIEDLVDHIGAPLGFHRALASQRGLFGHVDVPLCFRRTPRPAAASSVPRTAAFVTLRDRLIARDGLTRVSMTTVQRHLLQRANHPKPVKPDISDLQNKN